MDWLIIFLAKYLVAAVIAVFFITWLGSAAKGRKELALALIIGGLTAIILTKIAGALYFHPRPFVAEHIKPLIPHGTDNGFPSEHTAFAMTLSTLIYYYRKQLGWAAFALTLGIALGRVLAHLHSPIDILGGLVIGIAAGAIGYYGARKWAPKLFGSKKSS